MAPAGVAEGLARKAPCLLANSGASKQDARFADLMPTENRRVAFAKGYGVPV